MRSLATICSMILCTFSSMAFAAQAFSSSPGDLFAKYPADRSFTGKPHPPILTNPDAHLFRTRIREGVARGVAFDGHYEVAVWGCGSGCLSFAIIDAKTGKVNFFPATISQNREKGDRLTYNRHSKAIHVIGSLNEENSSDRWYIWNGETFILISQKPAELVDDDGNPIKP